MYGKRCGILGAALLGTLVLWPTQGALASPSTVSGLAVAVAATSPQDDGRGRDHHRGHDHRGHHHRGHDHRGHDHRGRMSR
ncbi:hypothetical protein FLW16_36165 [Microbispora sp. KK1-11]|nr:hypothetical protein FLW16_36165 [Microbispora sp. KK1-11]